MVLPLTFSSTIPQSYKNGKTSNNKSRSQPQVDSAVLCFLVLEQRHLGNVASNKQANKQKQCCQYLTSL